MARTTITLDDALERQIKEYALASGRSFKDVVDALLRIGYETSLAGLAAKPYKLKPISMGTPAADVDLVRAMALSDALEDEERISRLRRRS